MIKKFRTSLVLFCAIAGIKSYGQDVDTSQTLSLDQCLEYAYKHNPSLQQSNLDMQIAEYGIKSKISQWYPQIDFNGTLQHSFQLQKNNFNGTIIQMGVDNTSQGAFTATQNIFNSDALLASKTAGLVRDNAAQSYKSNKITLNLNVAKAFYDVLLYQEQVKILDENIIYLENSLKTARAQYDAGIVDKTDYKRAQISLNSTTASRKSQQELLKARYANLKMLMGYPDPKPLKLDYDSTALTSLAIIDTTMQVDYTKRIEYQTLMTTKNLQQANYQYYKWKYLPTVQAYGAYNLNYFHNDFDKVYKDNYPTSYVGLKVSVPIFHGMQNSYNVKQAKLNVDRAGLDIENIQNSIQNEYQQTLAIYKGYFANYSVAKENVDLSKDVYNTISLQYKAGVKTYLELIVAQTDLRTSELNYANALYQLLESKYDVDKALGLLNP